MRVTDWMHENDITLEMISEKTKRPKTKVRNMITGVDVASKKFMNEIEIMSNGLVKANVLTDWSIYGF